MVVDGIIIGDHENVWFLNMQKDIILVVVVVERSICNKEVVEH